MGNCNIVVIGHSIAVNAAIFDLDHNCDYALEGEQDSKLVLRIYELSDNDSHEFLLDTFELTHDQLESVEQPNQFSFDLLSKPNNSQRHFVNALSACRKYRFELVLMDGDQGMFGRTSVVAQPVVAHPLRFDFDIDNVMDQLSNLEAVPNSHIDSLHIKFTLLDIAAVANADTNCLLHNFVAKVESLAGDSLSNYQHVTTTYMTSHRDGVIEVNLNRQFFSDTFSSISVSLRQLNALQTQLKKL
ncbi:MAG: hypothetical protein MHMPM18_004071 [Marteilia pararefringens]